MRQAVLFYSFIAIFIVTAVVTLLGVVGAIDIPTTQLNMLLGAFLLELAGAVVALYRRTDFFQPPPTENLATALGSSFEALDQVSDEIAATLKGQPLDTPQSFHRLLVLRSGNSVAAYQKMQVVTHEQLAQLPKDQQEVIRAYERSMKRLTAEWKKLKESGTGQLDESVRNRMVKLLRQTKDDLVGLLNFLQELGIYLDDHYAEVRALVSNL